MFFSLRSLVAGALVATAAVNVNALPQARDDTSNNSTSSSGSACNNSPDLCSRQYNTITHMGAHGSSFLRDGSGGLVSAGNQYKNATSALDFGLRLLQAQVHQTNTSLHLCHTSCDLLDAGPLETWLGRINTWMTANPNEVVTIILVNSDDADAAEIGSAFDGSGLAEIAYSPPTTSATGDWPTLQSMIDDNKRLVAFVTNMDASTNYPYLIPQFEFVFETPFEVTSLTGFNCTLDRPSRAQSATNALSNNYLSLVNHFKYQSLATSVFVPDVSNIDIVNSAGTAEDGNLGKHLELCKSEWGVIPNFVLVDFFDKGDVIGATDNMNEISDATGRSDVADESIGTRSKNSMGTGALIAFLAAVVMLV